jgi:hypothetical protein
MDIKGTVYMGVGSDLDHKRVQWQPLEYNNNASGFHKNRAII